MNNIFKIALICILFITGGIFLIISPFSKKGSVEVIVPEVVAKSLPSNSIPLNPIPLVPHLSPRPLPETAPFDVPLPTKGVKEDIDVIKSYTDLIADMLQKIFGAITSGLGIFLTIKQLKDKKKKA